MKTKITFTDGGTIHCDAGPDIGTSGWVIIRQENQPTLFFPTSTIAIMSTRLV